MSKTHGLSQINGKKTRLYRIWKQMRQRCRNKHDSAYDRYGGRGIQICSEWEYYEAFHKWAISNGYKNYLEIDRIDNNGNYESSNCRWVNSYQQARNKRNNHLLTLNDETFSMAEWAERINITYGTLRSRINILGWNTQKALTKPVRTLTRVT